MLLLWEGTYPTKAWVPSYEERLLVWVVVGYAPPRSMIRGDTVSLGVGGIDIDQTLSPTVYHDRLFIHPRAEQHHRPHFPRSDGMSCISQNVQQIQSSRPLMPALCASLCRLHAVTRWEERRWLDLGDWIVIPDDSTEEDKERAQTYVCLGSTKALSSENFDD
jgi:hypothetical protein